jgi:hypothetical protein
MSRNHVHHRPKPPKYPRENVSDHTIQTRRRTKYRTAEEVMPHDQEETGDNHRKSMPDVLQAKSGQPEELPPHTNPHPDPLHRWGCNNGMDRLLPEFIFMIWIRIESIRFLFHFRES